MNKEALLNWFNDQTIKLKSELVLIQNNDALRFQYACVLDLLNFCEMVIHRFNDGKKANNFIEIYFDEYKSIHENTIHLLSSTGEHKFYFQRAFLEEKLKYTQKAFWLFEAILNKTDY